MPVEWQYTCHGIGNAESIDSLSWRCPDEQTPYQLEGPNRIAEADLSSNEQSLLRYQALLPVEPDLLITLGAGMSPLVKGRLLDHPVWFKLDSLLPTGSFKDRGSAVVIAHLRKLGVQKVIVDSSGNAAAAMSAFAAAAGISCIVYAPAATSPAKLVQSRAYGAEVRLVEGSRDDVATAAQQAAEADDTAYYSSHNWSPIFAEGVKTWALECWEQLGGKSPSTAFVPTGGGSAFMGAYRGFSAVEDLPRLIVVQPAACCPIVTAFQHGQAHAEAVTAGATLAEGTKIGNPARDRMILAAIAQSQGVARSVNEAHLVQAMEALWKQGIYAEPTGALGAAAFMQAIEDGDHVATGETLILITGSGLKATEQIAKLVG